MIWFTADWHIGHDKDFIYAARGFSNIIEHDTAIIKHCNELVAPDDELWILGDLAMNGNEKEWNRIYCSIHCQNVHYLQGNHDTDNKMDIYDKVYRFEYHGYADVMSVSKRIKLYLSHYPTYTDNGTDRVKVINLHGHTHSKEKFFNNNPSMYNVAVDAHDCYPVSLTEILKNINEVI